MSLVVLGGGLGEEVGDISCELGVVIPSLLEAGVESEIGGVEEELSEGEGDDCCVSLDVVGFI